MVVPSAAEVAKVDVKKADEYMANLRKAEVIFGEGVALEQKNDIKGAVEKYVAAAKIGHAYAAEKLGQLYDRGVTKTLPHDLQESIKYYQEARKRGKDIKGPGSRAPQPGKPD
jgi:TPR repeat protein